MKDQSVEAKIEGNNNIYKNILLNKSNITGLLWDSNASKKEKENNKTFNSLKSNDISLNKKNTDDANYYNSLSKKEKIRYVLKLLKNPMPKEPFDFLAVKRKKYTLSYLIHKFDQVENSSLYENNFLCKTPYPLLYCISNRKLGNNSSSLIARILWQDKRKLERKYDNVLQKSHYTKLFKSSISNLLKDSENMPKYPLKDITNTNNDNEKTDKNNINKNVVEVSTITNTDSFPFLNKYIKSKVNNYNFGFITRSESTKNFPTSSDFLGKKKIENNTLTNKIKRWSSTYNINFNEQMRIQRNFPKIKYNIISFKNRTVNLDNHKNNRKNINIINERKKKIIDNFLLGKRHNISEQKINEIIFDISHLKFNNQLKPFSSRLKDL